LLGFRLLLFFLLSSHFFYLCIVLTHLYAGSPIPCFSSSSSRGRAPSG
jgi:hypothetical protein